MLNTAVHVTAWFVIHQYWILSCCSMINWLTDCLPSEAFETKSVSNHNKILRLWCKVIANDCYACVVSAASTLCTLAMYHFKSYLEQSLTACIWTYVLYRKTQSLSIVWNYFTTNPKLGQNSTNRSTEETDLYLCFVCVHCNLMDGWWMYEMTLQNLTTINSEVAIQCSDRTE